MLEDWARESPKLQLLWGVPGLKLSGSIKSGPRKEVNQRQARGQPRLIDLEERKLASDLTDEPL